MAFPDIHTFPVCLPYVCQMCDILADMMRVFAGRVSDAASNVRVAVLVAANYTHVQIQPDSADSADSARFSQIQLSFVTSPGREHHRVARLDSAQVIMWP